MSADYETGECEYCGDPLCLGDCDEGEESDLD